ncbi:hypothetical protein MMPV_002801 [Pyropia vietnamensis]
MGLAGHTLYARGCCPVPVPVLLAGGDDHVQHAVTAAAAPSATATVTETTTATTAMTAVTTAAAATAAEGAGGCGSRAALPHNACAVAALATGLRALTAAVSAFCAASPGVAAAAVVYTRPAGGAAAVGGGNLWAGRGSPRVADDLYLLRFIGGAWGGDGTVVAPPAEEGESGADGVDAAVRTLLRAVVARTSESAYLGRALPATTLTVFLQAPAVRDDASLPPPPPPGITPARSWSPAAAGRTVRHRLTLTVRLATDGGAAVAPATGASATPGGLWYVVDTTVKGWGGGLPGRGPAVADALAGSGLGRGAVADVNGDAVADSVRASGLSGSTDNGDDARRVAVAAAAVDCVAQVPTPSTAVSAATAGSRSPIAVYSNSGGSPSPAMTDQCLRGGPCGGGMRGQTPLAAPLAHSRRVPQRRSTGPDRESRATTRTPDRVQPLLHAAQP